MVSRHQAFNLALLLFCTKVGQTSWRHDKILKTHWSLAWVWTAWQSNHLMFKVKVTWRSVTGLHVHKHRKNKETNKQTKNDSFVNLSLDVHLIPRYAHHCMLWIYHFSMTTAELKTWVCFCLCNCMSTVLGGHYRRSDRLQGTHSSTVFFHLSSKPLPLDVQTENGAYDSL